MKVEVHIDSHFQEEAVTITAPTLSARVENPVTLWKNWIKKGAYVPKGWGGLPDRKPAIPTFLH